MATTDKMIRIILELQDNMSSGLNSASGSLNQLGTQMRNVGTGMSMAVTAPIVAAGAAAFKAFADYESVMVEMQARTGATTEEMEAMSDMAMQMGRDTVFSATQAGQAMLELTSSGSSAAEAMQQLPDVLNLAAAGALELGTAADGVTDVLAMFQLEASQATEVTDALAQAAGSSSATVGDLLQGFNNVGPAAASFGLSVEETAATLAVFSENGIKGAEAGTQLRSMLLNMSRDTAATRTAWMELGVSMYDAVGNVRPLNDIIVDLDNALDQLPMEDQIRLSSDLAGSYGILGLNALRSSEGIDGMLGTMGNATSAADVANARMDTLSGRFTSLMGSVETLGITLGGLAEGPLSGLIEMATKAINAFASWAEANPRLAQTLLAVVAAIAAIGPVLIILGTLISSVSTIIAAVSGIGAVATAFSSLAVVVPILGAVGSAIMGLASTIAAATLAMGPLGWAIAAVVAAIALLVLNWDKITGAIGNFVQTVNQRFQGAAEALGRGLSRLAHDGTNLFLTFEDGSSTIGDIISELGVSEQLAYRIGATINTVINGIVNGVRHFATEMYPAFKEIGTSIIQGLIDGVRSMIGSFLDTVRNLAQNVVNVVKSALGIASPSKVMMEMGQFVVEGFNQGMDNEGGVTVGVPTQSQVQANVGGSGVTQYFTINPPFGSTSEQVEFISREIGKLATSRGASR